MSDRKKESMFAKLADQAAKAELRDAGEAAAAAVADIPPSPALPPAAVAKATPKSKKPSPPKGKRDDPDYCQANSYVPKALRRDVERALLDFDGLDYSTLVEGLLKKWLKSPRIPE